MTNSAVVLHMVVHRLEQFAQSWTEGSEGPVVAILRNDLLEVVELAKGVYDGPVLDDEDLVVLRDALLVLPREFGTRHKRFNAIPLVEKIERMRLAL